jgi:transposase
VLIDFRLGDFASKSNDKSRLLSISYPELTLLNQEPMKQPCYDSDLTNQEWQQIEPLLPAAKPVGKQREISLREVLNAIFYRADNGIKGRNLPSNFPAWQTVYGYYRLWVRLGIWEQINTALVKQVRESEGRNAEPSLTIIDSQSVKLGQKGGRNMALIATKKLKDANATLR